MSPSFSLGGEDEAPRPPSPAHLRQRVPSEHAVPLYHAPTFPTASPHHPHISHQAPSTSGTPSTVRVRSPHFPPHAMSPALSSPGIRLNRHLSRIATAPLQELPPPGHPQFAEELTPVKLRRKKRRRQPTAPEALYEEDEQPRAGPSTEGYYTVDGELYRGSTFDPTLFGRPPQQTGPLDDDAITIASSTASSGSSWSLPSEIQRGRRATMALVERFGEAIGVRRGSHSTVDQTDQSSIIELKSVTSRRVNKIKRSMSMLSRADSAGDQAGPLKRHLAPRRREFMLLVPPKHPTTESQTPTPRDSVASGLAGTGKYPSERVIQTPSLPNIMEKIKAIRAEAGLATPPVEDEEIRRGGSAPGRMRPRPGLRGAASFAAPPKPRPAAVRHATRVDQLKGRPGFVRPKSVSDLMGMRSPTGSSTNLSSLAQEAEPGNADKGKTPGCWWLDVSCPGWEDLRDLGELLGLHPLTLEDVLQQDPREKFDVFETLGYYFLVIRALDEEYFRYTPGSNTSLPNVTGYGEPSREPKAAGEASPNLEPAQKETDNRRRAWGMGRKMGRGAAKGGEKVEIVENSPGREGLEGVGVGGLNVYLVVFADGVVSFHFEDISKHVRRVLDRVISYGQEYGADWVAHGLLDSIVDAFFPLIGYVDGEVDDLDSLAVDPTVPSAEAKAQTVSPTASSLTLAGSDGYDKEHADIYSEKPLTSWPVPVVPYRKRIRHFISRHLPLPLLYFSLFWLPVADAVRKKHSKMGADSVDKSTMLHRITHMRRLVAGLTRILGAKHYVVAKLQKRTAERDGSVDAYFEDVEGE